MKTLVLLCLVAIASASLVEEFDRWVKLNGRHYTSPAEYDHRYNVWLSNLQKVLAFNSEKHGWEIGMNSMADLTEQEFVSMYLSSNLTAPKTETVEEVENVKISNVDWRGKGVLTPVKDQGNCGSCYTFSSTGAMESCKAIAGRGLVSLSEQQLVDCTVPNGNLGCSGGWMTNCFDYVRAGGIESGSQYPYTATKGTCKANSAYYVTHITGYTNIATSATLQSAIVGRPIAVALDASTSWQLYSGGIWCGSCTTTLNHAVLLVGTQANTPDYYIVKNSWGTGWGESGYIRMCATPDANKCGISSKASYPTGCS